MEREQADGLAATAVLALPSGAILLHLPQMVPAFGGGQVCAGGGGLQALTAALRASVSPAQLVDGLRAWGLMVLVMAPLLLTGPVAKIARRPHSLRALAALAAAYGVIWIGGGLAMLLAMPVLQTGARTLDITPLALTLAIAVAWQATPWKQRALNLCHRTPPPCSDLMSEFRFGAAVAAGCLGACWVWMLSPMLVLGDSRPLMVATVILLTAERFLPARRPTWRLPFLSLAMLLPGSPPPVIAEKVSA